MESRERWKACNLTLEDLLTGEWINLPETHEYRMLQKEIHDGKVGTPYEEIQKGRRLMQATLKLAKPLLPKMERQYETVEEIPEGEA